MYFYINRNRTWLKQKKTFDYQAPVVKWRGDGKVSRSLYVFRWQGGTDIQTYNAHSLYRLKVRWIKMPDFLLARKCIQLLDPLPTLPFIAY